MISSSSRRFDNENGSMLVMAVLFSFLTVFMGMAFLTTVARMQQTVDFEVSTAQANYDASAGVFQGLVDYCTSQPYNEGWQGYHTDNRFRYHIIPAGQQDINFGVSSYIRIVGTGWSNIYTSDNSKTIQAEYAHDSYADFLYLSDKERDAVRHETINFWTPDTLDGKVHSNDTIRIQDPPQNRPVFKEFVSVTPPSIIINPGNGARFLKKKGIHSRVIFPDMAHEIRQFNGMPGIGTNPNGLPSHKDSLTQIVFDEASGVGFFRMRYCGNYTLPNGHVILRCDPQYLEDCPSISLPRSGALFVNGKVWLSASKNRGDLMDGPYPNKDSVSYHHYQSQGFVGRLTVASSDTMIITDNLVYNRSTFRDHYYWAPTPADNCLDVLGLISENWIMIGKQTRDTVDVNAAMAAIRGSISVQDIYAYGQTNVKQSLFIHGSLAQRNRGIVHTTYQNERGFIEKDYHYDWRLLSNPPPHYLEAKSARLQYIETADYLYGGGN